MSESDKQTLLGFLFLIACGVWIQHAVWLIRKTKSDSMYTLFFGFLFRSYANYGSALGDGTSISASSAPQGKTQLEGFAWPCATYRTIDDQPAAFYSVSVKYSEPPEDLPSVDDYWASDSPFLVADANGSVMVFPGDDVELGFGGKTHHGSDLNEAQISRVLTFLRLARAPYRVTSDIDSANLWITEHFVLAGTRVVVSGFLDRDAKVEHYNPAPGLHRFLTHADFLRSHSASNMRVLDLDHDGRVSEQEWQAAYARTASGDSLVAGGAEPGVPCVGVMRDSKANPVRIADRSPGSVRPMSSTALLFDIVKQCLFLALGITILGIVLWFRITNPIVPVR